MNWKSTVLSCIACLLIVSGGASLALADHEAKVKLGERIHFNSSVCFELSDLMEIREYSLANNGDGYTAYQKKKAEKKCLPFSTRLLGAYVILDEIVPNSEFTDALLGQSIFVKFHIEGSDKFLYGVMGPDQLDLAGI